MTKVAQVSFSRGELSGRARGQVFSDGYLQGLISLENAIQLRLGGVRNRWGTQYVGEVDGDQPAHLIEFETRNSGTFLLELRSGQMRAWKQSDRTLAAGFDIATPWTGSDVFDVYPVATPEKVYLLHKDTEPRVLDDRFAADSLTIVDTSAGPRLEEVLRTTDITRKQQVQNLGTLFPTFQFDASEEVFLSSDQFEIFRYANTWLKVEAFINSKTIYANDFEINDTSENQSTTDWDGPFVGQGAVAIGVTVSGSSGTAGSTVTLDADSGTPFLATDVGSVIELDTSTSVAYALVTQFNSSTQLLGIALTGFGNGSNPDHQFYVLTDRQFPERARITPSAISGTITMTSDKDVFNTNMEPVGGERGAVFYLNGGAARITNVTNAKTATADVERQLSQARGTLFWSKGYSTDSGFPRCGDFFQNRLYMAGVKEFPNHVYASKTARLEDFTTGIEDDQALNLTLPTCCPVNAMGRSGQQLLILSDADDFVLSGLPVTPTNFDLSRNSGYGSSNVKTIPADRSVIHVQSGGDAIREAIFSDEAQRYLTVDITDIADHLFESEDIRCMAVINRPEELMLFVAESGKVLCLGRRTSTSLLGWNHWNGSSFESVARGGASSNELWVVAKRVIDGTTKYLIEVLTPGVPVDSQLTITPGSRVISGLDHLEGEDVAVRATDTSGGVLSTGLKTVSGGSITLPKTYSEVVVGLPIPFRMKPNLIYGSDFEGTEVARDLQVHILYAFVNKSRGGRVEDESGKTYNLLPFTVATSVDETTGWVEVEGLSFYPGKEPIPVISSSDPFDLEVMAIVLDTSAGQSEGA